MDHPFRRPSQDGQGGHYAARPEISLNCNLAVPTDLSATAASNSLQPPHPQPDGSHTPNTPEILNSILSIQQESTFSEGFRQHLIAQAQPPTTTLMAPPEGGGANDLEGHPAADVVHHPAATIVSHHPENKVNVTGHKSANPGTVKDLTSQLIKAGLQMKVKQNIVKQNSESCSRPSSRSSSSKMSSSSTFVTSDDTPHLPVTTPKNETLAKAEPDLEDLAGDDREDTSSILTPDDEYRRKRRRERNKIAATKCRNKKKARTQLLLEENDTLCALNESLRSEIRQLEQERARLADLLTSHLRECQKPFVGANNNPADLLGDPSGVGLGVKAENDLLPQLEGHPSSDSSFPLPTSSSVISSTSGRYPATTQGHHPVAHPDDGFETSPHHGGHADVVVAVKDEEVVVGVDTSGRPRHHHFGAAHHFYPLGTKEATHHHFPDDDGSSNSSGGPNFVPQAPGPRDGLFLGKMAAIGLTFLDFESQCIAL